MEFPENEKNYLGELTKRVQKSIFYPPINFLKSENEKSGNLLPDKSISFKDNFPTNGENTIKTGNMPQDSIEYITRVNKLKEIVNTAVILKLKVCLFLEKNIFFKKMQIFGFFNIFKLDNKFLHSAKRHGFKHKRPGVGEFVSKR